MTGRARNALPRGPRAGVFGCRAAVLRLGGDERHVQHDRRAVTARDGHREGVVAQRRGQPAPRRQADFQLRVGGGEPQRACGQSPHGIRRHRAEGRRVAHPHQRKAAFPCRRQAACHGPHADDRTQAVVGVQQGEQAALVNDVNLRCRVDAAGLQAADGVLQPRDVEGVKAGGLAQGALQADVGDGFGILGRDAGALVHLPVEGVQVRCGNGCGWGHRRA